MPGCTTPVFPSSPYPIVGVGTDNIRTKRKAIRLRPTLTDAEASTQVTGTIVKVPGSSDDDVRALLVRRLACGLLLTPVATFRLKGVVGWENTPSVSR